MTEELDTNEFEKWILEKGIGEKDIRIPLLKEAWNRSLHLACNLFGENEGVDFGAEEKYFAY